MRKKLFVLEKREKKKNTTKRGIEKRDMEKANKTLNVREETKTRLDKMKKHPRETADDVLSRILDFYQATEPL